MIFLAQLTTTTLLLFPLVHGFQPLLPITSTRSPPQSHIPSAIDRPCSTCNNKEQRRLATTTTLRSLQSLFDHVEAAAAASSSSSNSKNKKPPIIFVGGKGGVGKTTISSAIAVQLSHNSSALSKILVVSTDPAHSLGDCLDVDDNHSLTSKPTCITEGLYAQEVDAAEALERFRDSLAAFDIERLAAALQIQPSLLESLGLQEISGVLQNPPPGLDELVAMADIFGTATDTDAAGGDYDAIVVDTAPTGHTLRLLALPQFLDGLLGKLIRVRMRLSGIASTLQTLLGGGEAASQRAAAVDDALSKIEDLQQRMAVFQQTLTDAQRTQFVVVSIPTALSVAESKRLVADLQAQSVAVPHVVVNQCVTALEGDTDTESSSRSTLYYDRRRAGQQKWMERLRERVVAVAQSKEYQSNGAAAASQHDIRITEIPFFDVELVGVPALGYVGAQVFQDWRDDDDDTSSSVIICGGKGGVGKTTTAASLGVTLAASGRTVALISTDPAHSLGDAVGMQCSSTLQQCALIGVPGDVGTGSLSVMEIDPTKALNKFKGYIDSLVASDAVSNPAIGDTLKEISEIFDTLPAGTDEVVALAQIVGLVKEGKYDRIILDTAPTGHTLRMISTPGFIADLIERILKISDKINSSSALKMFLGSRKEEVAATVAATKSKLLSFQFQMYDLEDLFSNPESTEFLIVTIATELAVRESMRLLNDLTLDEEFPVKVKNVIVNQVLDDDKDTASGFLAAMAKRQRTALSDLQRMADTNNMMVTKVPYLDTEPRGVYGLRALAKELIGEGMEEPSKKVESTG